ncbi:MAG: sulfite exporter TauE/SafE family protein [Candidatus Omnitrophica bacterium]|nr:sulfite exporter TauE/SafE family protein [Candidatus Omnitrophota bacterium]
MESILILIIVFFIALFFSMFGMGGGLFYMPVFLFFLKDHADASFLSFLCIFVTAISAMSVYYRKGLIDWKLVKYLGAPLIGVVFVTGFLSRSAPNAVLRDLLGVTLVLAGIFMVFSIKEISGFARIGQHLSRLFPDREYHFAPIVLTPLILFIGFLSGMSGVAGGVFEIPIMIGLLRTSAHTAVATSSAIVTMVALSGALGRLISNHHGAVFSLPLVICIVFGALLGGQLGPNISTKLDKKIFKRICGLFVLSIGAYFIIK